MKQSRKIVVLASVTLAIIMFWLVPGINTAKDTTYTRFYEDTDTKPDIIHADDTVPLNKNRQKKLVAKRRYKKESIRSADKLSKVNPKMFSRAVQYQEMEVVLDSVNSVELDLKDSVELSLHIPKYPKKLK